MDEAQAVNIIVVDFPQEKINFINEAHQKRSRILEEGCVR